MRSPSYCYWSLATGPHAGEMELCIASAREAGVFKEFHVLTDRPIEGAESYDAHEVELTGQLYKLVYLKAGISKLNFDYYVWIDADTRFRRTPKNLLASLSVSPVHVPLEANLSKFIQQSDPAVDVDSPSRWLYGLSIRKYVELYRDAGVINPVHWGRARFWIVRRSAVDKVCELALHFRAFAKEREVVVDASAGLNYAMQMLCGDPSKHLASSRPDLWVDVFGGDCGPVAVDRICPITGHTNAVNAAIVHLSNASNRGGVADAKNTGTREKNHEQRVAAV